MRAAVLTASAVFVAVVLFGVPALLLTGWFHG